MQKTLFNLGVRLFFLNCCLASVLMLDPTRSSWGFNSSPILRYVLPELALVSWALLKLGGGRISLRWQSIALTSLVVLIISGSLYTVFILGENNLARTWMGRGLNALAIFPAYHVFSVPNGRRYIQRRLPVVIKVAYVSMIIILWAVTLKVIYLDLPQVYHIEGTFLLSAGWYWVLAYPKQRLVGWVLLLSAMGGLILIGKFTSLAMIVASVAVFLLLKTEKVRFKADSQWSQFLINGSFRLLIALILAAGAFFSFMEVVSARFALRDSLVRTYTFSIRQEMFKESPLIGAVFTGDPLMTVPGMPFDIPSHSEWLDLAAFGGVLALGLLLLPAVNLTWKAFRKIAGISDMNGANSFVVFCLYYLILAFVAMVANSLIIVSYLAFWLWFALGVLLAYSKVLAMKARHV